LYFVGERSIHFSNLLYIPFETVPASTATAPHINPDTMSDDKPRRPGVPLDVVWPGLSDPSFADAEHTNFETQVTKLDSGLSVASQPRPGRYCTVGVAIKSGARYEKPFVKGVAHVAEKLGFLVSYLFTLIVRFEFTLSSLVSTLKYEYYFSSIKVLRLLR